MTFRMLVWDMETGSISHRETFDDVEHAFNIATMKSALAGTRSVGLYNEQDRKRHIVIKNGEAFLPFTARRIKTGKLERGRALTILQGDNG